MTPDDIQRKMAKLLEAKLLEALTGGLPAPRPTALRLRGRTIETVELDYAGNVIEPIRCTCIAMIVLHRPSCPFYNMVT